MLEGSSGDDDVSLGDWIFSMDNGKDSDRAWLLHKEGDVKPVLVECNWALDVDADVDEWEENDSVDAGGDVGRGKSRGGSWDTAGWIRD